MIVVRDVLTEWGDWMKIKKTITLNVEREGKYLICRDLHTASLVVGTSSLSGNPHIYKVVKKNNKFYIPLSVVKERIKVLGHRKQQLEDSLEIMQQVVKWRQDVEIATR